MRSWEGVCPPHWTWDIVACRERGVNIDREKVKRERETEKRRDRERAIDLFLCMMSLFVLFVILKELCERKIDV